MISVEAGGLLKAVDDTNGGSLNLGKNPKRHGPQVKSYTEKKKLSKICKNQSK